MDFNIYYYIIIFLSSLALGYFFARLMMRLSFRFKILDIPNQERKIHDKPIPLLGGWAIFLSFVFVLVALMIFFPNIILNRGVSLAQIIGIVLAGFVVMISGTLDDKYDLSAKVQFFWIIVACIIIIFSGTIIQFITRPGGGIIDLTLGMKANIFGLKFYILGAIISFVWLLFITNATKLLDGLDGLASGVTGIGMMILFVVSLFWDRPHSATSILILIFAGSIFGFLILNFYPAKIFLGNGGSNLLGLFLGALSIISGAKIATALLVMGAPLIDMIWVMIQRIVKKQSPFRHADKKHLHFRLMDLGLSKPHAALVLYCIAFAFGVISLFQNTIGKIIAISLLLVFMVLLFYYIHKKNKNIENV